MNKGRTWTAKNPAHSDELWARAKRMNVERPGNGEWAPKEAIELPDWQARMVKDETVRAYADVSEHLPPIRVQRDTFVLIDGRHRYSAEPSDCIRIIEDDVSDDDLFVESVRANVGHGLPYTREERQRLIREMLKRYPQWSDGKIGEVAGCHRQTVMQLRPKDQVVGFRQPDRGAREGRDGKQYPVRDIRRTIADPSRGPKPAPKSFDPGAEREPLDEWERATSVWEGEGPFEGDENLHTARAENTPEPRHAESVTPKVTLPADDDEEPYFELFHHIEDGFELKASVRAFVPDPQGRMAERYDASVIKGVAGLRAWCDQVEADYAV